MKRILLTGSLGQLGTELINALIDRYGSDKIVVSDLVDEHNVPNLTHYEKLDVTDKEKLIRIIKKYEVGQIYHLAAILSAKGEQDPINAWRVNMNGLTNVLEAAHQLNIEKIYWPSSIAVFGPNTPRVNTPQHTVTDPATMYGISKLSGERWCEYFHHAFGVDVRSLRYPGLIGYKARGGGGTTDYAVDIYHEAISGKAFTCYLEQDTRLPMMYMDDAVKATLDLMDADPASLSVRSSYNITALSFTPEEIAAEIRRQIPGFQIIYQPDFRQEIAESWPDSIDDSAAKRDWGWEPQYTLSSMTTEILTNLQEKTVS